MTSILDTVKRGSTGFHPSTSMDICALRLASKLNEPAAAAHYAGLLSTYGIGNVISAFGRALSSGTNESLAKSFHLELAPGSRHGHHLATPTLLAVRVERRAVAIALFRGLNLEHVQTRQLDSARPKAIASALHFLDWLTSHFTVESVALETISSAQPILRQEISVALSRMMRENLLPIWEINKADLFTGFGHPALESRKELREVVSGLWPILANDRKGGLILDAVALGLHVQVERYFLCN